MRLVELIRLARIKAEASPAIDDGVLLRSLVAELRSYTKDLASEEHYESVIHEICGAIIDGGKK